MIPDNPNNPLSLITASQLIEDVFGIQFCAYQKQDEWSPATAAPPHNQQVPEELSQFLQSNELTVAETEEGCVQVAIPVHWFDVPTVAVGKVKNTSQDEAERLGRLALRLMRQHAELQQQTELFEELIQRSEENTWLRSFSELVENCSATHPVQQVARNVLPRLKQLIDAGSVCFFPSHGSRFSRITFGKPLPPTIEMLVEKHQEQSARQPVVINARSAKDYEELGLSSFALVQVGKHEKCIGWVAAVDRCSSSITHASCMESSSEHEFGTVEAGLLEAAAALLGTHAHNVDLFQAKEKLTLAVIQSFVKSLDARDPYTKGHSDRVALYSKTIAHQMKQSHEFCEEIYLTGLLHDIGKIGIPDAVLKKNGKLTDEEYDIIKLHPVIGYNILQGLDGLDYVLNGVRHHHERPDGRGYPDGLAGHDVPLEARIMSVADAYDAMTSSRAYRKHMSFEKAESIVRENIGSQFDEAAADSVL